jgi:hypothetical protein
LAARRLAHLAVALPPLFVLIGVVFFLLGSPRSHSASWPILWMTISAAEAWVVVRRNAELAACSQPNPISLRMAHGISALLIILAFLGGRLLNHGSAAFSPTTRR